MRLQVQCQALPMRRGGRNGTKMSVNTEEILGQKSDLMSARLRHGNETTIVPE